MEDIEVIQDFQKNWKKWFKNCFESSLGALRGLALFWDLNKFTLRQQKEDGHWIMEELEAIGNQEYLKICNVYGLVNYNLKPEF